MISLRASPRSSKHTGPGWLQRTLDCDRQQAQEPTAIEEERHREFAAAYFSGGAGPTIRLRTCVITESSDGHFVLGSHLNYESVHVAAGFTGHGFKFTAVVGEILADFVVDGDTTHTADLHRIERFFDT